MDKSKITELLVINTCCALGTALLPSIFGVCTISIVAGATVGTLMGIFFLVKVRKFHLEGIKINFQGQTSKILRYLPGIIIGLISAISILDNAHGIAILGGTILSIGLFLLYSLIFNFEEFEEWQRIPSFLAVVLIGLVYSWFDFEGSVKLKKEYGQFHIYLENNTIDFLFTVFASGALISIFALLAYMIFLSGFIESLKSRTEDEK